jgi:hypothetical protein
MLTKANQHGVVKLLPHTGSLPVAQSTPACHAAAKAHRLGKLLPWNSRLQHEQDAVECSLVTDQASPGAAFTGGNEGGNQWLQLQPHLFAYGTSGHEGAEHNGAAPSSRGGVSHSYRMFRSCEPASERVPDEIFIPAVLDFMYAQQQATHT